VVVNLNGNNFDGGSLEPLCALIDTRRDGNPVGFLQQMTADCTSGNIESARAVRSALNSQFTTLTTPHFIQDRHPSTAARHLHRIQHRARSTPAADPTYSGDTDQMETDNRNRV
jgi:hypothetical protein